MLSFAFVRRFARAYRRALFQPVIPIVWVVISAVCVVAAPFGTMQLSVPVRFAFWPVTVGFGILIGGMLRVVVRDYLGQRRFWPEAPIIAILATLVLSPLLVGFARVLAEREHFTPSSAELAAYVFFVSMATSTLRHTFTAIQMAEGRRSAPGADPLAASPPPPEPDPEPVVRLMARIPAELRAPLIRLQMRDHYVDVLTDAGTSSLLLRFADAIAETGAVEGMQVHRSHWVARRAIRGVIRQRGRVGLLVQGGAVVPVSRANAAAVLALGLPEALVGAPPGEAETETEAVQ